MSGELAVKPTTPIEPSSPGGLAILCFIVGAPHIYGVIQAHHRHPPAFQPARSSRLFILGKVLATVAALVILYEAIALVC